MRYILVRIIIRGIATKRGCSMRKGSMIISSVIIVFLFILIYGILKKDIKITNEFKTYFVIDVK